MANALHTGVNSAEQTTSNFHVRLTVFGIRLFRVFMAIHHIEDLASLRDRAAGGLM
jgi:hypothetical protein